MLLRLLLLSKQCFYVGQKAHVLFPRRLFTAAFLSLLLPLLAGCVDARGHALENRPLFCMRFFRGDFPLIFP
jgi:hypothetical protein